MKKWIKEFQEHIDCYCPCHIDFKNVFSFRDGIHCDNCYDKRVYNWDKYMK